MHNSGGTDEARVAGMVERYIALYRREAGRLGPVRRFFVGRGDEAQDIQWEVQELTGDERPLYDALRALYVEWLEEMSPAERAQVFEYNQQLPGRDQDVILGEDLFQEYAAAAR